MSSENRSCCCAVCFDEVAPNLHVVCGKCRNHLCFDCLTEYLSILEKDKSIPVCSLHLLDGSDGAVCGNEFVYCMLTSNPDLITLSQLSKKTMMMSIVLTKIVELNIAYLRCLHVYYTQESRLSSNPIVRSRMIVHQMRQTVLDKRKQNMNLMQKKYRLVAHIAMPHRLRDVNRHNQARIKDLCKTTIDDDYDRSTVALGQSSSSSSSQLSRRIKCSHWACFGTISKEDFLCAVCGRIMCFKCERALPDDKRVISTGVASFGSQSLLEVARTVLENEHVCNADELSSIEFISKSCHCPRCNTPIEKSEGCKLMTCAVCGHHFHYETGETIKYGNNHNKAVILKQPTLKDMCGEKISRHVLRVTLLKISDLITDASSEERMSQLIADLDEAHANYMIEMSYRQQSSSSSSSSSSSTTEDVTSRQFDFRKLRDIAIIRDKIAMRKQAIVFISDKMGDIEKVVNAPEKASNIGVLADIEKCLVKLLKK